MSNAITFEQIVDTELARARKKHPAPIHSVDEGYALLLDKLDAFWGEARKQRSPYVMLVGLAQVAAMAQRVSEDVLSDAMVGMSGN